MSSEISIFLSIVILLIVMTVKVLTGPIKCSKSKFTAIIGGSEVNHISEVPYQLSLQYYGKHRCGGSVISEFWGISAGHCLYRELNIDHLRFVAGLLGVETSNANYIHEVEEYHQHPLYNKSIFDYDIALSKVKRSFLSTPFVKPIKLATQNMRVIYEELATASGWGKTDICWESGLESKILLKVHLPLMETNECQSLWTTVPITDSMVCAGYQKLDTCAGDSGGPLVYRGLLIGVTSWGSNICGTRLPSAFAFISNPEIRQFIRYKANV